VCWNRWVAALRPVLAAPGRSPALARAIKHPRTRREQRPGRAARTAPPKGAAVAHMVGAWRCSDHSSRALLAALRTRTLCAPALRAYAEAARARVVRARAKTQHLTPRLRRCVRRRGQHGATDGVLSCVHRRVSRGGEMCGGQARELGAAARVQSSGQEHARVRRRRARGACGCDACGQRSGWRA
jgi:hypothetical protein